MRCARSWSAALVSEMTQLRGLGVSPGVALGRALLLKRGAGEVRFRVAPAGVDREITRLDQARERSRQQLLDIKDRLAHSAHPEHAALFDAQLLMLDDPLLIARASDLVRTERANAEWALEQACAELSRLFEQIEDPYLRERKGDVADVVTRLQGNLRGTAMGLAGLLKELSEPHVIVADELPPSLAAQLDWSPVVGFATDTGSWTHHSAILARSLNVPAAVGLHDASRRIPPGAMVLIDGASGDVYVDPPVELREEVQERARRTFAERRLAGTRDLDAITLDGVRITLEANLELHEDLRKVRESAAGGIGLYRSEFLLGRRRVVELTEAVQYEVYRSLLEGMAPGRVTVRIFDASEEQLRAGPAGGLGLSRARLGLRAIRLNVVFRELFRTQFRALLRAARHGSLRIMFPFVSGLEEFREAKALLTEVAEDLRRQGEPPPDVPAGAMLEIPSAALTADLLAREADFFSIGTNDLIQFCLAVDRIDDRVQHLYDPLHPAVLRLIRYVRRVARHRRLPLAVCGEMAADPLLLPLLIGLGITEFSMAPPAIPAAKQTVREIRTDEAAALARRVLQRATRREAEEELKAYQDRIRSVPLKD
jgi:phosphoenolpyruvate-protein phosphotransferase (PTS system enzyme I)